MSLRMFSGSKGSMASIRRRWLSTDTGEPGRESVGETLEGKAQLLKNEITLLAWGDLPHWQQHGSELIHTGYRKATGSILDCFHSWTYIHNETVNIFSHIIGAAIFLPLPVHIFTTEIPPRCAVATSTDILVCSICFLGIAICFILSTLFHTLMSHSPTLYHSGMTLDILGVLLLMWSTTVPLIHYSPLPPTTTLTLHTTTALLALLSCFAVLLPRFSGPTLGTARAALFASFGTASFVLPVALSVCSEGLDEAGERMALEWVLGTVVANGVGLGVYAVKFPEKWYPGRFDLFGASHQVMHIMVLVAALCYAKAVLQMFDFRHGIGAFDDISA